ncbi:hypothetical protein HBB16_05950 [Pseudonocardia sp. MCCB 268]|nr:hypothetical protein [Pseudonocardia cytotoxica]
MSLDDKKDKLSTRPRSCRQGQGDRRWATDDERLRPRARATGRPGASSRPATSLKDAFKR